MKTLKLLFLLFLPISAMADGGLATTEQLIGAPRAINTECASRAFAEALDARAENIDVNASEEQMKQFVYDVFQSPETLGAVVTCPEIADSDPDETIRLMPIQYTFSNGRQLVINYETQPRVLTQRLTLAAKRELPTDDPNPAINPLDQTATWVNTDPAWYAIMVVQRGALDDFVGPDKNNTVSMAYIDNNIENLYPAGASCTSKTAIANDHDMINRVMAEKTVGDDSQDYYVAGNRNLRWISYAEIAADVVMSVVSWGGFAALSGVAKMARVMDAMKKLGKNMKTLSKMENVQKYIRKMAALAKAKRKIQGAENAAQSLKNLEKLENALKNATKGTEKYEKLLKEVDAARNIHADNLAKLAKESGNVADLKNADKIEDFIRQSKNEVNTLEDEMKAARKADSNVEMFHKHYDSMKDLAEYSNKLRKFKQARSGNVLGRAKNIAKSVVASRSGAKKIDKAIKLARAGERSLSTVDNISKLSKALTKSGEGLAKLAKKTDKYGKAIRELALNAGHHMDEVGKLTKEQLSSLSKIEADDLAKIIDSERDAIAAFTRSTERLTDLEKASERATKLEKELSGLKEGSPEYKRITEELRRLANDELVKAMPSSKAKEYRNLENRIAQYERRAQKSSGLTKTEKTKLKSLNQERSTLLNQAGRKPGLTASEQIKRDLEFARKANLDDASKLTKAVKAVTSSISKFGLKRTNMKSVFRHSLSASSARDWLFHSTLRNVSRVAHVGEDLVALHFVLGLVGDFWDVTSASTDEYTNGIAMKPLLLLSADDIPGQENVVNYGMWLMWQGAHASQESDDAAYLEAMDFAQKFWEDMIETAVEDGQSECDVDIYVVRPIIRNPGTDHESLYWLIMNDKPWTVLGGAI